MEILLFKNFSKRRNSTKQPTLSEGEKRFVRLKESTSYEAPTFLLNSVDFDYNYCVWGGHCYFITDITLVTGDLFEISCTQDVLATYKSQIANYECLVTRSESAFDNFLIDSEIVSSSVFNNESYAISSINTFSTTGCYIIRTLGSTNIRGYVIRPDNLTYIMDALTDTSIIPALEDALYNPFDYLVSIKWFPFDVTSVYSSDAQVQMYLGKYRLNVAGVYDILDTRTANTVILNIPNNIYDDFRAYDDEFSHYKIYIPGVGLTDLSAGDIQGNEIYLEYCADLLTGDLKCRLYRGDGATISYLSGTVGVDIQLGKLASTYKALFTSAVSGLASAATGNILGVASSAVDMATSKYAPTKSINGTAGNVQALKSWNKIVITLINVASSELPISTLGKPCGKVKRLGTLTGYTRCAAASINIAGLCDDKEAINAYLNSGFYME